MSLASKLAAVEEHFAATGPADVLQPIRAAKADHIATFSVDKAVHAGDKLPGFKLPNALGQETDSADILRKGPMLVVFYRGLWCPFCNIMLHALQDQLDQFAARRVTLVAISPELPDSSLDAEQKRALRFPVLSDAGNALARQLGLVWKQPDYLRDVLNDKLGHRLAERNGDDSSELPVPTVLLVDQQSLIRNVHIDADWARRLEPADALAWIDTL